MTRVHTGQLLLRGQAAEIRAQLSWCPGEQKQGAHGPTSVLLVCDSAWSARAQQCTGAAARLGAMVITLAPAPAQTAVAADTLGWLADHAAELGADPARLVLAGLGPGACRVAIGTGHAIAIGGWPPMSRLMLAYDEPFGTGSSDVHVWSALATPTVSSVTVFVPAEAPPLPSTFDLIGGGRPVRIPGLRDSCDRHDGLAAAFAADLADVESHPSGPRWQHSRRVTNGPLNRWASPRSIHRVGGGPHSTPGQHPGRARRAHRGR